MATSLRLRVLRAALRQEADSGGVLSEICAVLAQELERLDGVGLDLATADEIARVVPSVLCDGEGLSFVQGEALQLRTSNGTPVYELRVEATPKLEALLAAIMAFDGVGPFSFGGAPCAG